MSTPSPSTRREAVPPCPHATRAPTTPSAPCPPGGGTDGIFRGDPQHQASCSELPPAASSLRQAGRAEPAAQAARARAPPPRRRRGREERRAEASGRRRACSAAASPASAWPFCSGSALDGHYLYSYRPCLWRQVPTPACINTTDNLGVAPSRGSRRTAGAPPRARMPARQPRMLRRRLGALSTSQPLPKFSAPGRRRPSPPGGETLNVQERF